MGKLGPHIIRQTGSAMEWAKRAPTVKALDSIEPLKAARYDAVRVYRKYFGNQDYSYSRASDVAVAILNDLDDYHHPNLYVEAAFNEIPKDQTEAYADFLEVVVAILSAGGYKTCGPCWSTGDFDYEQWEFLRKRDWLGLSAIALHAYWADLGPTTWNAYRYRTFWRPGDPPVLITECGRDYVRDGRNGTYIGNKGWRNDGISPEQYLSELRAFDAEISRDPYVLGAQVFTAGADERWSAFDTNSLDTAEFSGAGHKYQAITITTGDKPVSEAEFDRLSSDIFKRAGVPYNPTSAFIGYWKAQAKAGKYLGKPEGPEFRTENGKYAVQIFSGAILHCRVGEWVVKPGLPPF